MTERKPQGVSFETWVDKQIREAEERGAFKDLPGAGKPIPGIREPDDEMWWVNGLMKREKLVHLPPSLQLRKDAEAMEADVLRQRSAGDVRATVEALNHRILEAIRKPISGPPHRLVPYDVEEQVARWRAARPSDAPTEATPPDRPADRRWWRRTR